MSKIAQKVKKLSNTVFHEVFDVLKKETIKQILYEGVKHIPNAIHTIESWTQLLL
ncbi:MAG: hypothetical protein ABIU11_06055 [Chitinophagaceae bacterium]